MNHSRTCRSMCHVLKQNRDHITFNHMHTLIFIYACLNPFLIDKTNTLFLNENLCVKMRQICFVAVCYSEFFHWKACFRVHILTNCLYCVFNKATPPPTVATLNKTVNILQELYRVRFIYQEISLNFLPNFFDLCLKCIICLKKHTFIPDWFRFFKLLTLKW